jgi:hypothetical protein
MDPSKPFAEENKMSDTILKFRRTRYDLRYHGMPSLGSTAARLAPTAAVLLAIVPPMLGRSEEYLEWKQRRKRKMME